MARALTTGWMLACLTCPLWRQATEAEVLVGKATYMSEGKMQQVLDYRGTALPPTKAVALNRDGDRGRWIWLQWPDGQIDGPMLVVDCAQRGAHYRMREKQGRVVEVSAEMARERGFFGEGPVFVVVWLKEPPAVRWN